MINTVKKSRNCPLLVTSGESTPPLYWQKGSYVNFWAISEPGKFGLKRGTAAIQSKVRLKMIHYRAMKNTLILIHTEIKHKHYKFT